MKFNKKGQGALEYLLLIGGAVLIAVIVIALLVGMGSQSRDSAREQANKAQQNTDIPLAAHIISVDANYAQCIGTGAPTISVVNWNSMGGGGTHVLKIMNTSDMVLGIADVDVSTATLTDGTLILNPGVTAVKSIKLEAAIDNTNCGDSYYVVIESTKNNQTVKSQSFKFHWK